MQPKVSDCFFTLQSLGLLCTSTVSQATLNAFQKASLSLLILLKYDRIPFVHELTVPANESYAALHDQGNGLGGILRKERFKQEQQSECRVMVNVDAGRKKEKIQKKKKDWNTNSSSHQPYSASMQLQMCLVSGLITKHLKLSNVRTAPNSCCFVTHI